KRLPDFESRGGELDPFGNNAGDDPARTVDTDERRAEFVDNPEAAVASRRNSFGVEARRIGLELAAVEIEDRLAAEPLAAGDRQTGNGDAFAIAKADRVEKLDPVLADAQPGDAGTNIETRHHLRALTLEVLAKMARTVTLDQGLYLDVGTAVANAPDDVGWIVEAPGEAGT